MLANGSPMRNRLIEAGYTPDQLNIIDAHLAATYFAEDKDGGMMYEFADNLRIARANNAEEVREYERDKRHGCCGYYDKIIEHPDGYIMIGFNYGH